MRGSKGTLGFCGSLRTCKQKSQVTRTFGPSRKIVVQAGRDLQVSHTRRRAGLFFSLYRFQDPALRNWNHHHARGLGLSGPIGSRQIHRMAEQQLFQADQAAVVTVVKSQGARAKPANRPRGNLQRPYSLFIDAKFRVDRALRQAQCSNGIQSAPLDIA